MPKGKNAIENEDVKKFYDIFVELEKKGEWDKIMDLACSTLTNETVDDIEPDPAIDEAFDKWAKELFTLNQSGKISGYVKEEKLNSFNELAKAYGRNRAKYAKMVNDDIEETKERIKNGEIKGAELWTENDEALTQIASSYVYEHNQSAFNMNVGANNTLSFTVPLAKKPSIQFFEKAYEGIKEYADSLNDDKALEKINIGFNTNSPTKCRKYGLKLDGKSFVETDLKKEIDKIENYADLDALENINIEMYEKLKKNKDVEDTAKAEAKTAYQTMKEKIEDNSQYGKNFKDMMDNLSVISNAENDKEYDSFPSNSLTKRLKNLHDASAKYIEENDVDYEIKNGKSKEHRDIDIAKEAREKAEKIIKGAKEDLEKLEKMTREGHKNSTEYNQMRDALKDIANIDINKTSIEEFKDKINTLGTTSAAYDKTHDKWYKAVRGYGKDRLDMSKHLRSMAKASDSLLSDIPKYYSSQPLGTLAESIEAARNERVEIARDLVNKTNEMLGKIVKLPKDLSNMKINSALESYKEDLEVIKKGREDRIHAKVNDVQKKMENASGEELRELAASNIYLTGIEKANKDQKKHFSLEETLSSDAILTGTFKIAETNAFKEMSKLPDDELRSLAVKDGGRQLTAKYLKNRAEEAEMQRSRNATKEMAKEMHLDNKISPKSKEAPTKAVKTI